MLDGRSVKTAEAGSPRGHDAGKKVLGRKRHAMVDPDGRALKLHVHLANVQDRDGVCLLKASRPRFPFIELAFADTGYAGERVACPTRIAVEIVRKQPGQVGFTIHPRRWVVERFFAWLGRNRRLARDFATQRSPPPKPLRRFGHALAAPARALPTRRIHTSFEWSSRETLLDDWSVTVSHEKLRQAQIALESIRRGSNDLASR